MLSKIGFQIESINKPNGMTYNVLHKARPIIILPLQAIDNNVVFLSDTAQRFIRTTDGQTLEVASHEVINIIDHQEEIQQIYGMPWYQFAEKWHRTLQGLHMVDFFKIITKQQQNVQQ